MKRLSLLAASFWLLACSSTAGGPVDGNADPQVATCNTKTVMSCTGGGVCHAFYSQKAADAIRSDCRDLGDSISTECSASYSLCCIHMDGSNDLPEGLCVGPDLEANLREQCQKPGYVLCGT